MRRHVLHTITIGVIAALFTSGLVALTAATATADPSGDATLTGTVRDKQGKPISGVSIYAWTHSHPTRLDGYLGSSEMVFTDEQGHYTAIAPAGYVYVTFSSSDYKYQTQDGSTNTATSKRIAVGPGQTRRVDVTLSRLQPTWQGSFEPKLSTRWPRPGSVLSVAPNSWGSPRSDAPPSAFTITYQWSRLTFVGKRRIERPIPGANRPTFTLREADLGHLVSVTTTASHPLLAPTSKVLDLSNPVQRKSVGRITSTKPKKKRQIRISVKVSAMGLPYATGKVSATCGYKDKGHGQDVSRAVALKKGRATIVFKAKRAKKSAKTAYCFVYYPGTAQISSVAFPDETKQSRLRVKLT